MPSPQCGALFTGVTGALICERCLNSPVARERNAGDRNSSGGLSGIGSP